MTNREIGAVLEEIGTILEIRGENPFKCRAFHNAARVVSTLTLDLRVSAMEGSLTEIPGIGKGLAPIISDLTTTGKSIEYETIRASIPAGLLELMKVQGLGPKKIKILHDTLGIDSPARLREAAVAGRLATLEGFGEKSQVNILQGLAMLERSIGKRLYPEAEDRGHLVASAPFRGHDVHRDRKPQEKEETMVTSTCWHPPPLARLARSLTPFFAFRRSLRNFIGSDENERSPASGLNATWSSRGRVSLRTPVFHGSKNITSKCGSGGIFRLV